jgi:hypothetical protein
MVPIKCIIIPKDRIYLFKAEFARVEDAILNYANFINIINTINIVRIIFIRIKLGCLNNFKD